MLRCPGRWWWVVLLIAGAPLRAAEHDWPTWRYDAGRTGATALELASELHLQWKRELPTPQPAFPHDPRVCFDRSYEPIVVGHRIIVPSMVTDSITAYDTQSGREAWTFFSDGPVRFAPVAAKGRVYFVSDDGCLYCVDGERGHLLWKFCGLPADRIGHKLLGNERLISRWPARGGPVLADGRIYFTAGIWPNEGVFVYAVDADTGRLVWKNSDVGFLKEAQLDHGTRRDGGLAPQGYLAVIGGRLVVPCGRALPAFFDRATGHMEPYTSGWGGRIALAKGCWYVCGQGDYLFQSGDLYALGRPTPAVSATAKTEELVSLADFAQQMNVDSATVEKWIKQYRLETVDGPAGRMVRVRSGGPITYLSWWTCSNREALRPGEQHALESRCRLQVDPANTKELGPFREPVLADDAIYYSATEVKIGRRIQDEGRDPPPPPDYTQIVAFRRPTPDGWTFTYQGGWGTPHRLVQWPVAPLEQTWDMASRLKVHIKAGSRLYAGAAETVAAIDIPSRGREPAVSWQTEIEGTPSRMLAAGERLFVVTIEGSIYCFGAAATAPETYAEPQPADVARSDSWTVRAGDILRQTGANEGYCLALGLGSGRLVEALLARSKLHVIVLDPDQRRVDAARSAFLAQGLYGSRVHVLPGDLDSLHLPPFMASLIVCEAAGMWEQRPEQLFALLRPYGGAACLPIADSGQAAFRQRVQTAGLPGAVVTRQRGLTLLARTGELAGAADWPHERGDAAQTFTSHDLRAKPPFGVLWFGGGVDRVIACLKGPAPRVAAGRMFFQLSDELHAADIYTGRHLWQRTVNRLGEFAVAGNDLYAISSGTCLRLDAATGAQVGTISASEKSRGWRQIRIAGDALMGTAGKTLVCIDRRSGQLRWRFTGQRDGLGLAIAEDRVFCVDWWLPVHRRRGEPKSEAATISALDFAHGKLLWQQPADTPALTPPKKPDEQPTTVDPQLAYSAAADVLLFTRNKSTAAAYQGTTGRLLWAREILCKDPPHAYGGAQPPIVLDDVFITHGGEVVELATGVSRPRMWKGMNQELRGCGRALGCPNMITVRDGNLSYFDLETGTHSYIRGVRSGCTNSLIPAGGLLNAPNYARHCTCNWPMSVSLALVPMPEAPRWDPANVADTP